MITVIPVRSFRELLRFIRLPWKIYHYDPHWVPPLISDQRRLLDRSVPPVVKGARGLFLAENRGRPPLGRLAVLLDSALNLAKGYTHGEGSTIGEANLEMRREFEGFGGQRDKTYRLYQKTLGS